MWRGWWSEWKKKTHQNDPDYITGKWSHASPGTVSGSLSVEENLTWFLLVSEQSRPSVSCSTVTVNDPFHSFFICSNNMHVMLPLRPFIQHKKIHFLPISRRSLLSHRLSDSWFMWNWLDVAFSFYPVAPWRLGSLPLYSWLQLFSSSRRNTQYFRGVKSDMQFFWWQTVEISICGANKFTSSRPITASIMVLLTALNNFPPALLVYVWSEFAPNVWTLISAVGSGSNCTFKEVWFISCPSELGSDACDPVLMSHSDMHDVLKGRKCCRDVHLWIETMHLHPLLVLFHHVVAALARFPAPVWRARCNGSQPELSCHTFGATYRHQTQVSKLDSKGLFWFKRRENEESVSVKLMSVQKLVINRVWVLDDDVISPSQKKLYPLLFFTCQEVRVPLTIGDITKLLKGQFTKWIQ